MSANASSVPILFRCVVKHEVTRRGLTMVTAIFRLSIR